MLENKQKVTVVASVVQNGEEGKQPDVSSPLNTFLPSGFFCWNSLD